MCSSRKAVSLKTKRLGGLAFKSSKSTGWGHSSAGDVHPSHSFSLFFAWVFTPGSAKKRELLPLCQLPSWTSTWWPLAWTHICTFEGREAVVLPKTCPAATGSKILLLCSTGGCPPKHLGRLLQRLFFFEESEEALLQRKGMSGQEESGSRGIAGRLSHLTSTLAAAQQPCKFQHHALCSPPQSVHCLAVPLSLFFPQPAW